MKHFLIIPLAFLFASSTVFAEKASDESIRALMQSTGSGDLGIQIMNQMIPSLKKMIPDAPEDFWNDFMSEFDKNELIERIILIYQEHLTQEDIDALNEFYSSSTGKKIIIEMPLIMQKSMVLGQEWGQRIARKVVGEYNEQEP